MKSLLLTILFIFSILLNHPYCETLINYDEGIDQVKGYIKNREFEKAEETLKTMLSQYTDNPELLYLLGKVLFWQKKYDESIGIYERLLKLEHEDSILGELQKVKRAKLLQEADILINSGKIDEAEALLISMYESDKYNAGYRLGMLYIKKRDYEKAIETFKELKEIYPEDIGFTALYIESLILEGDIEKAKRNLYSLPQEKREFLKESRDDLFYRVRRNYLMLSGSLKSMKQQKGRSEVSLEISQRFREIPIVIGLSNAHRFGNDDQKLEFTVYSKLGEKTKRWGYVTLAVSLDADFLPVTVFGGELYQGYNEFEFSIGYRRMNFKDNSVDIFMPGVIIYLPFALSLQEKLYIVPESESYALLSILHYEPTHIYKGYYSISFGKSSERISSIQDIQKLTTISNKLGIEYKLNPSISIGVELSHEYRQSLYTMVGTRVFIRNWW